MHPFAIILPAAGRSVRFGGSRGKLLELLAGEPLVRHSVRAFLCRADVSAVIVATPDEDVAPIREALADQALDPRISYCRGGDNRAQSVWNALKCVPKEIDWVAVHDAARPLVSQAVIDRTFAAAIEHGAAVPAMPVALTIKRATGPLPAPVEQTVPRHALWAMQTPQAMRRADLLAAFDFCPLELDQITDDAQLIELAGKEVWLVAGEEKNLKITTRIDLDVAVMMLAGLSL